MNLGLTVVENEYRSLLEPELQKAIEHGEPRRAASFAKELARLRRKESQQLGQQESDSAPIRRKGILATA